MPVPPARAGETPIEVRFTYDINGLLEVDILVTSSGKREELVIFDEETTSADELERRRTALAALKQHPRDSDANRQALARAARCYESFLGDLRAHIGRMIDHFEAVLARQDPREVEAARVELMRALDGLEGETLL